MSKIDANVHKLKNSVGTHYWANRIIGQLWFGKQLSIMLNGKYDALLEEVSDWLLDEFNKDKILYPDTARTAEQKLIVMKEDAKKYKLICVSHAHIDMNWMWRYDETVITTIDTFRTMLILMEEYPDFKFSQSQASVYEIVQKYATEEMKKQIAQRISEGRWEITASTWVEADKNMPNAESMARHQLYTRRYLADLFGIDGEKLNIDYEPDTFGHCANVPEILGNAGVKYYYHMRGAVEAQLSWWKSRSGAKVLNFFDQFSYNSQVDYTLADPVMNICGTTPIDTALRVYGVGDHGGGPTRRDIERIIDMMDWPVYPTLKFGTYHEFFEEIEKRFGDILPVRETEKNFQFTGCYSSQSRIKAANRIGEASLYEAELYSALADSVTGCGYPTDKFADSWKKVLFSQFHDILTGSGVMDTREYALGQFQEVMAVASTAKTEALLAVAGQIDSSSVPWSKVDDDLYCEGAGPAFGVPDFKISQVSYGYGSTRLYHFFNSSCSDRTENVEVWIYDWPDENIQLIEFSDENGKRVPHAMLSNASVLSWGSHRFIKALVRVSMPAYGYTTLKLSMSADRVNPVFGVPQYVIPEDASVENIYEYVLENELVYIEFDKQTGSIIKYIDKQTGENLVNGNAYNGFRFIEEDTERGMTAWRIGRLMNIRQFDSVYLYPINYSADQIRKAIGMNVSFGRSTLTVEAYLDEGSKVLRYKVMCDWFEVGRKGCIPQLAYMITPSHKIKESKRDIPAGVLEHEPIDMDLPANSFMVSVPEEGSTGLMLSTDTRYGYRCYNGELSVNLLRNPIDPDPCPEYGMHKMEIAVLPADISDNDSLVKTGFDLWHPVSVISAMPHKGTLPMTGKLFETENVVLQAVKEAEDGSGDIVIRTYENNGVKHPAKITFAKQVQSAHLCDLHENIIGDAAVDGNSVIFETRPYGVQTIRCKIKSGC